MLRTIFRNAKPSAAIRPFKLQKVITRGFSSEQSDVKTVTLFPGDGVGPEVSAAVVRIFSSINVPVKWEKFDVGADAVKKGGELIPNAAIQSVIRNKVALKGPLETPVGTGHKSANITLRKVLQQFVNVRPCRSFQGIKTRYENVNLVTLRENTEGYYSGVEHEVVDGVVTSIKIISELASRRVAEYAFKYAEEHGSSKVSAIHRADVQPMSDGMFVRCCREASTNHPSIKYEEVTLANCVMHLAYDPSRYEIMVLPNLYGDIVSDLASGLVGGLGLTPSANIGATTAMFEAVHGSAPDIAGQNKANPTALLLSSIMMLRHLQLTAQADQIEKAVLSVLADNKVRTRDIGGTATCTEYTDEIIRVLKLGPKQ